MTDLLDALFFYVDPQYRSAVLKIEHWEESLTGRLDEEGQTLFERYQRACFDEQDRLQRALFRAVLTLRRDLDLVLLWGWRR